MDKAGKFTAVFMVGLWMLVTACALSGGMNHMDHSGMHHGKAHMMECCVIGSSGVEVTPVTDPSPFFAAVTLVIAFILVLPPAREVSIYHPPRR